MCVLTFYHYDAWFQHVFNQRLAKTKRDQEGFRASVNGKLIGKWNFKLQRGYST